MTKKFNRKYRTYDPDGNAGKGPPTERICKRIKCDDDSSSTPPAPPTPPTYP